MVAEMGHVLTVLEGLDLVGHAAISTHKLSSFIYLRKSLHAATSASLLAIKATPSTLNALRYRHAVIPILTFIVKSFTIYD